MKRLLRRHSEEVSVSRLKDWLKGELKKLRAFKQLRKRDGIYRYLGAILRTWAELERRETNPEKLGKLLRSISEDRKISASAPPLRALLDLISNAPAKQRWKWYCALEYACQIDCSPEDIQSQIDDAGGINACVAASAERRKLIRARLQKRRKERSSSGARKA
jgi:hypothetical protein